MQNEPDASSDEDTVCPLCQAPDVPPRNMHIRTTKDVLSCVKHFRNKKQEYLICLSLDGDQRLIARRIVTIGLLDQSLAHPREVFAAPLKDRAAAVIIIHNHPSGDANPSQADIKTTQHLAAAGQILGLPLRDHVIITVRGYYSLRGHHLL